ncbi:hypothetical protein TcBrA4_0111760 [Trypanosoma cruzi]|nr:hypothetical protein TcBrA4_0111760 [Trypanosoma cruzi]
MPGTWNSSPQSGGRTERNSRRKRKTHTPHDRRLTVWRNSIPGVDPDIVPRAADLRTGAMRHLPALRHACARPADHKQFPLCRWRRPFLYRGDPPASASAGTSSTRKRRNSLSTSERRIDILLLNLRQGAPVCPQYDGTRPKCSVWRSDSLTGPPMRMPQWRQRLLGKRPEHRSPPKIQACQRATHAGSTNAGTRDGPCPYATASSQTSRAADSTTDHGRLRLIHCGDAASLGIWTATVWNCPSPHEGLFAMECLPRYC